MMTKFGQNFAKELTWVLYIIACVVINLWPETYSLKLRPECIMPKGNLPSHPRHRDLRTPQLVSPRETTPTGPNPNPKMDIPPPWFPTAVSPVPGQRGGGGYWLDELASAPGASPPAEEPPLANSLPKAARSFCLRAVYALSSCFSSFATVSGSMPWEATPARATSRESSGRWGREEVWLA